MQPSSIEVWHVLKNLNYPLTKQELIQQALKHGASCEVIDVLKNVQDKGYTRASDVTNEFKGKFRTWG